MQVFKLFSDIPEDYNILYPDGTMRSKAEVAMDYPILSTSMGVIGFTADSKGTNSRRPYHDGILRQHQSVR